MKNGYKRFHDLTIDIGEEPKRIVALVGANGCGKSSVLDGILYHHGAHEAIGNKGGKDHNYHSMTRSPTVSYQNVVIEFSDGTFNEKREALKALGASNTMFSFRSPYRYNSALKVKETRATAEIRLNNYGATTSSDIDDKMEQNYRRVHIMFNKFLKENPGTATYDSARTKILGDINTSLKQCLDLEIVSIGDIGDDKGTFFFKKTDHPNEFEFDVLSSCEKEVVDILLDLYLRQDAYSDSVFLIDEPELHINTAIQRKLLIEINKLVGTNCQIWIATHSIGFLRALQDQFKDDCQIIKFSNGVNWASAPQVLTPMKKTASVMSRV